MFGAHSERYPISLTEYQQTGEGAPSRDVALRANVVRIQVAPNPGSTSASDPSLPAVTASTSAAPTTSPTEPSSSKTSPSIGKTSDTSTDTPDWGGRPPQLRPAHPWVCRRPKRALTPKERSFVFRRCYRARLSSIRNWSCPTCAPASRRAARNGWRTRRMQWSAPTALASRLGRRLSGLSTFWRTPGPPTQATADEHPWALLPTPISSWRVYAARRFSFVGRSSTAMDTATCSGTGYGDSLLAASSLRRIESPDTSAFGCRCRNSRAGTPEARLGHAHP